MFGDFLFKNNGENRETEIEELYRKHRGRLFNIAMRYLHSCADAEDAVQNVFSQIIEEKTKIFDVPPNKQAAYLNVLIRRFHTCFAAGNAGGNGFKVFDRII